MDRRTLGKRLREEREATGMSQVEVAARLHVVPSTITRYENGSRIPSVIEIEEYAHVLGIPVSAIYGEESDERPIRFENEHLLSPEQKRVLRAIAESAANAAAEAYIRAVKPRGSREDNEM